MANVNTTCIIEVSGHGTYTLGKHGAVANSLWTPLVTTVAGGLLEKRGTVAAGASASLYDVGQGDLPATWLKLYYWADVATQLQLIEETSETNVVLNVAANDPVILSGGKMLAAANATVITDGAALTVATDKIIMAAAVEANYHCFLVL